MGVRTVRIAGALALAILSASCAGGSRGEVLSSPQGFPGYPKQAQEGPLWASAVYDTNSREFFDTDFVARGILPVAIQIGVRGDENRLLNARLSGSDIDPHLYLQDGTALPWLPAGQIDTPRKTLKDRITECALEFSLLPAWESAPEGFLFFAFDPKRVEIDDTVILSRTGEIERELDLFQSLLGLTVTTEAGPVQIFVGLKPGRWQR